MTRATFLPLLAPAEPERLAEGAVLDEYCGDLAIAYSFGPPFGKRIVTHADLQRMDLNRRVLRRTALEHLEALAGRAQFHGQPPALMLSFEGLESSLLLAESFWLRMRAAVPGDLVVGVPARDVVIVTGSQSAPGLEKARRAVDRVFFAGDDNLLSRRLLIRRGGMWEPFDGPSRQGGRPAAHSGDQRPRQYQEHPSWPAERVAPVGAMRPISPVDRAAPMRRPVPAPRPGPMPVGPMPTGPAQAPLAPAAPVAPVAHLANSHRHPVVPPQPGPESAPFSSVPYPISPYGAPSEPRPRAAQPQPSYVPPAAKPRSDWAGSGVTSYSAAPTSSMPYSAAPYSAAPYSAAPSSSVPYSAAPYSAAPYSAAPYSAAPYSGAGYDSSTDRPYSSPPAASTPAYPASWGASPDSAPVRPAWDGRTGARARFSR